MSRIHEWMDKRKEESANLQKQIDTTNKLLELYPDLDYQIDRWKNFRYTSSAVTTTADKVYIHHSCGCCGDAALLARPYVEVSVADDTVKVFSNPGYFTIGERAYSGDHPDPGWRTRLREHNIQESVIEQIERYFEVHAPCDDKEDSVEALMDELGF